MELCTGGSLFNMLDDPENAYGLDEKEFFLVLRHLCKFCVVTSVSLRFSRFFGICSRHQLKNILFT